MTEMLLCPIDAQADSKVDSTRRRLPDPDAADCPALISGATFSLERLPAETEIYNADTEERYTVQEPQLIVDPGTGRASEETVSVERTRIVQVPRRREKAVPYSRRCQGACGGVNIARWKKVT